MNCKGNNFYKLLMRLGMKKEAEIYWKNHIDIEGLIKRSKERRKNGFAPMLPDVKTFSKN